MSDIVKKIPMTRVTLTFSEDLGPGIHAHSLRGAIAALFPEEDLLHQHLAGKLLYRYPYIQYRWQGANGFIVGFFEGAHLLAKLPLLARTLVIDGISTQITNAEMRFSLEGIEILSQPLRYTFVSPWLPFNQENFERFAQMEKQEGVRECERIAVGNLLTAFRGLKIELRERLTVTFQPHRQLTCKYKDKSFLGFYGTLLTNVDLPNDLAIGKAVSHGFGWLKGCEVQPEAP